MSNMLPCFAIDNGEDIPYCNTVFFCKFVSVIVVGVVAQSNFGYLHCGKFSMACFLTFCTSILGYFISHIVGLGAEKEVGWFNTCRPVAPMQDEKIVRDRPNEQFVGHMTSTKHAALPSTRIDNSVAFFAGTTDPRDATIRQFATYILEKAVNQWGGRKMIAFCGAESPVAFSYFAAINKERFMACSTDTSLPRAGIAVTYNRAEFCISPFDFPWICKKFIVAKRTKSNGESTRHSGPPFQVQFV